MYAYFTRHIRDVSYILLKATFIWFPHIARDNNFDKILFPEEKNWKQRITWEGDDGMAVWMEKLIQLKRKFRLVQFLFRL